MAAKPTTSSAQRCAYSGLQGKQLFYDAINFLFAIKGEEFSKRYPGFTTPSVEEFLGFCTSHRSRINQLHHFIHFICRNGTYYDNLHRGIFISLHALSAYTLSEYFLLGEESISTEWVQAFVWFINQTKLRNFISRDVVLGTVGKYIEQHYFRNKKTIADEFYSEVDAVAISKHVIFTLQTFDDFCLFTTYVQIPILMIRNKDTKETTYKKWIIGQLLSRTEGRYVVAY